MSVLAITVAAPHPGKRALTESRARQLGGIYARHGASVKLAKVVAGPNAGSIALIRGYADFRSASKAFQAVGADPANTEFWREREANPSADIVVVRNLLRVVYGENKWSTYPVSLLRGYDLARDKVADAMAILAEVSKLAAQADVNVIGVMPVTGENLSSLTVSYQFKSPDHFGEALDTVGASEEFQALVAKAAAFGSLKSAFLMTPL